ncbi:MAG TPA: shikimate dehydrogenase [Dehalococcoidia bacterium]|nr:shikimate dehydrogenase [Dehalococcoidia bacterium]
MKLLGVIGWPLEQSLSPAFQQAALDHLGLDIRYEAWPTPREELEARVRGLRAPDHLGANVTIPHKEAVIPFLDELDDLARRAGAVNTIVNREGRLAGYNTDVTGFLRALREDGTFDPAGCRALIAGAGGAARAVVVALIEAGAASVTVINRTFARATELVEDLQPFAGDTELHALPDMYTSWAAAAVSCRLLVNCTSVGLAGTPEEKESPVPVDVIPAAAMVYDLLYRPAQTSLMAAARRRGARVLGGLPMLVYQGADSLRLWTGLEPPVDIMFDAARWALARAGTKEGR